jgi:predicted transcriptional regulator
MEGYQMQRTTIFADEYLLREIKDLAKQKKRSVAEVVREALVEYIDRRKTPAARPAFIGLGDSGRTDLAEKHEALLWPKP